MTINEALAAVVGVSQIPAAVFEKALIDSGLTGTDVYTADNADSVNEAAVTVLSGLLVSSISEGGYSITFDRKAVEAKIQSLGGNPQPEVRAVNVW